MDLSGWRLCVLVVASLLIACGGMKDDKVPEHDLQTKIKIKRYVVAGRQLYNTHCANCHQAEGEGLAALYPPVRNADYLKADIGRTVCIMKNGMEGEITVNGKVFNQKMPAIEVLTDLELAELSTFLLNGFNDSIALVTQQEVRKYLEGCEERGDSMRLREGNDK